MSGNLERRYRLVLRLLPGYYRQQWEEDMVAAFLDSWLTGDPQADEYIAKAARPSLGEVASVACLAIRLYLGGAGTPRRYFAWEQATRRAVLAVTLVQAVRGLDVLVLTAWSRRMAGWLPAPPPGIVHGTAGGALPPAVRYLVACAWIVTFVTLALRYVGDQGSPDGRADEPAVPDDRAEGEQPLDTPGPQPSGDTPPWRSRRAGSSASRRSPRRAAGSRA